MSESVNPIPEGYGSITPSLTIDGCAEAIEFYKKAFDAEDMGRADGSDGKVLHAAIKIGDSMIMMSDEFPDYGSLGPKSVGGTPVGIWLYVEDVDAVFKQAVEAGAEAKMPPSDMFWGDRMASVVDPYGHSWSIATHIEDVSPEEMEERKKQALEEWG